jgi:hypothetical protein
MHACCTAMTALNINRGRRFRLSTGLKFSTDKVICRTMTNMNETRVIREGKKLLWQQRTKYILFLWYFDLNS